MRSRQRSERRSVQRGASVEFAEYRPFVSGDDWRYIDWNAFARWRQLVLKLFVEEEDLHVHLLLDCTVSMDWGAPVKFDYARQLIAGLGLHHARQSRSCGGRPARRGRLSGLAAREGPASLSPAPALSRALSARGHACEARRLRPALGRHAATARAWSCG